MSSWLLRGVAMTALNIIARIAIAQIILSNPLSSNVTRVVTVALLVLVALIWGGIDGIRDARAHEDPDDYEDLTMRWLKAGLLAGFVSCLVCWVVGTFWMNGIGQASFPIEIIAGTSFIALLTYIPAFIGASVGRALVRRDQRKTERAAEEAREAQTEALAHSA